MQRIRAQSLIGVVVICTAAVAALRAPRGTRVSSRPRFTARPTHRQPSSASQVALTRAQRYWGQALIDVKPEMEAQEAVDPYSVVQSEERRQWLMARDQKGYLRKARDAAAQAVALARTSEETYPALIWLALIEGDRGHFAAELQAARRLRALRPHDPITLGALRRAAQHNGLNSLDR